MKKILFALCFIISLGLAHAQINLETETFQGKKIITPSFENIIKLYNADSSEFVEGLEIEGYQHLMDVQTESADVNCNVYYESYAREASLNSDFFIIRKRDCQGKYTVLTLKYRYYDYLVENLKNEVVQKFKKKWEDGNMGGETVMISYNKHTYSITITNNDGINEIDIMSGGLFDFLGNY